MIGSVKITGNSWISITTAGQYGSVYAPAVASYGGMNTVLVTHGPSSPPEDTIDYYQLDPSNSNYDSIMISPDSGSDIYYARCVGATGSATIIVDVV